MAQPTAIDLFSGAGGLSVGLKSAGFRVLAAVERDPTAAATYTANHANVKLYERDIKHLSAKSVLRDLGLAPGDIDLVAGCPPCQGFSAMRTLNGHVAVEDRRNELIFDFLRFVRVIRPKAVMLENVPALSQDVRFAEFKAELQRLGYKLNAAIKDARRYGVPQRRRRLIMLAGRGIEIAFGQEAEGIVTVGHVLKDLPHAGTSGDPVHDLPEKRSEHVQKLIAAIPKDGGSRKDLPPSLQLKCHQRCDGFKDVYGRMAWGKVAPTITSGCFNPSKGRFLHPTENRAITMREAALLQGFPRDYSFPVEAGKSAIALMIGNALPPEFIRRHALSVLHHVCLSGSCA